MARSSIGMLVPGKGAGDFCRVETSTGAFIGKDQVSAGLADWTDGPGPVLHPSCSSTALDVASCVDVPNTSFQNALPSHSPLP